MIARLLTGWTALSMLLGTVFAQTELPLSNRTTAAEDRAPVRLLPENVPAPALSPTAIETLKNYWLDLISDYELPGAAIGIVQEDGMVLELCVGKRNVREEAKIDAETRFNLGEATLAFTTLMAATADKPDFPIFDRKGSTISPLFRMTDPRAQQNCRVRDLLTMTAGAPPYTDEILDPQWAQPEDVFALLGQAPVMSPPGDRYRKSQISATVGGYLAAMAIGNQRRNLFSNYIDVSRERLLEPLGMQRATFSSREVKADPNHAEGHLPAQPGYNPAFTEEPDRNPLAPLLGLKLSLSDAALWIQTELRQGVSPGGQRLAAAVSVRERWQPAPVQNSAHRGMGWTRRYHEEVEIIEAQGFYGNQSAAIGIYPAFRTGFIVFTNASGDDAQRLLEAVTLGLAETLKDSRQGAASQAVAREGAGQ